MEEADFLADRIGIIDCGKIAALGTASDLKKRVQEKQTIMINALNLTINNLNEIKSRFKDIKVQGACISISGTMLDFKQVTDFVHSTGATIRSAYYKEPSLEDAYLKITGKEFAR
jgi:ABC-2 type transport system ATP-binding protein